ncbi:MULTISPECIES: hypothetical protein [unclassified Janthinobacterium]|uniref:hypothetical protein n=1 Tax=unclassified Janthinobacterium TaxID=2610881 RepID=UPI00087ECF06|nr:MULTISPECIES: hypothetical protein [unclassified Janthinobacterium]SDA57608.1 hypothetical protein SAMN03159349_02130 [Janthinobacterium sp. 551a]SFB28732.1 hypothetical protein SAMN03159300_103135 [Janthinobacterium sp. 344]
MGVTAQLHQSRPARRRRRPLTNQIGQLSLAPPFQPFGLIPTVGYTLIVGTGKAAGRQLTHFALPPCGPAKRHRGRYAVDTREYLSYSRRVNKK